MLFSLSANHSLTFSLSHFCFVYAYFFFSFKILCLLFDVFQIPASVFKYLLLLSSQTLTFYLSFYHSSISVLQLPSLTFCALLSVFLLSHHILSFNICLFPSRLITLSFTVIWLCKTYDFKNQLVLLFISYIWHHDASVNRGKMPFPAPCVSCLVINWAYILSENYFIS